MELQRLHGESRVHLLEQFALSTRHISRLQWHLPAPKEEHNNGPLFSNGDDCVKDIEIIAL